MTLASEAQRREILRVLGGLRRAIEASVSLSAPVEALADLAERAEGLAGALEARVGERPLPRYASPFDPADPNAMITYSPITGRFNPLAPPVELRVEPGTPPHVLGSIAFGKAYEGPPSSVHGSIVASVYDQLLALAAIAAGHAGPTATLTVHFRKMTPLHVPLRFEAWVDRVDGRKAFVRGTCHAEADLLSESEGLFVRLRGA
jgi:acyl-coenzyme A thioesterase PaaI-like protein